MKTPLLEKRALSGSKKCIEFYTDQELDPESGLYNCGARLYDPIVGKFITPDSMVPDFSNPQCLNRYAYCVNNPLIYADPNGEFPFLAAALVGAWIGAAQADINGGDFGDILKGAAIGGISGLITAGAFSIAGGILGSMGAQCVVVANASYVTIHAIAGGAAGVINSAISGGDIGTGALTGAFAGAFGAAGGLGLAKLGVGDIGQLIGRTIIGGLSGGIASEIAGGDFGVGAVWGAATAALAWGFNDKGDHEIWEWAQKDPKEVIKEFFSSIKSSIKSNYGSAGLTPGSIDKNSYNLAVSLGQENKEYNPEISRLKMMQDKHRVIGLIKVVGGGSAVFLGYASFNGPLISIGLTYVFEGGYSVITNEDMSIPSP